MRRLRMFVKGALLQAPYRVRDALRNRRWAADGPRFLIVRHAGKSAYFRDYFLHWLAAALPEVRARFELRLLPCYVRDWSRYVVCAPWLKDPAIDWLPRGALGRVRYLEKECDRRGIPIINRLDSLSHSVKSVGARIIAGSGVRTPRLVAIDDPQQFVQDRQGLEFPLIVREDRAHAAPTCLVENERELRQVPWPRFAHPVAAEFIDVRDPRDGLYRKYRYVAAGARGLPRHLIVSRTWEVRAAQRVRNDATREEELAYLRRPDPNDAVLQRVRQALELDLVAFDYSYDRAGRLVVWEANPCPDLSSPVGPHVAHLRPYVERSYALLAAMYLSAGGLPWPGQLRDWLAAGSAGGAAEGVGQGDGDWARAA